jgi:hypothetical protein
MHLKYCRLPKTDPGVQVLLLNFEQATIGESAVAKLKRQITYR